MENTIAFTVKGSGNLFFISAGRTLINFIEFDISPFYSECRTLAESAVRTGEFEEKYELAIKDILRSCHPYFAACYNSVFDKIVLDCVIDILCRIQGIGLEAMWAKNISAEDSLGKAVFARISDYKTGHAVNQWANLQRMQNYAEKKARFIFAEPVEDPVEYDVRAMYFDLSFSTAADMAGIKREESPAIRCTPTGLLAAAPEMFSPVSGMAASMIGSMPHVGGGISAHNMSESIRELNDGVVCAELMRLPQPDRLEMVSISKKLKELPRRTYVPESLKAAIDLEFDELLERKLMLELVPGINRFELRPMYRPAPPPPEFNLRPLEEYEDVSRQTRSEEVQAENTAEEVAAAPAAEQESEPDDIPEIQPEKLYAALEPEAETEIIGGVTEERVTELQAEPLPEPIPEPVPEPIPEPIPEFIPEAAPAPIYEPMVIVEPEPSYGPKIIPVTGQKSRAGRKPKEETKPEPIVEKAETPEEAPPYEEPQLIAEDTEAMTESDPRKETEEQNKVSAKASKMEIKRIAAPVAEIAMLTDSSYGRKPRKDRRAAPMDVPETLDERMQLLQKLAADKRRSVKRHEGTDVDILCQSVHTALSAAMKDERSHDEEERWAKLLFRIRGGVMTRRYSTEYLYRFLDATIEMYRLDI